MGEGAVGNCPPLLWKVEDGKTNLPNLFGIKFKKKSFFYYISMQAYIVQIANGIRVCFETIVTVLKIYQTNKEYIFLYIFHNDVINQI